MLYRRQGRLTSQTAPAKVQLVSSVLVCVPAYVQPGDHRRMHVIFLVKILSPHHALGYRTPHPALEVQAELIVAALELEFPTMCSSR